MGVSRMSLAEIKSFMGNKLDSNGDIEGAIPVFEVRQQAQIAMKQFAENQNKMILEYCFNLKIDPYVLEKQLKEIQMLKMIIKQKDEQIEKMKNCRNCKNWNWKHNKCDKRLKGDCLRFSKWELAE